MGEKILEIMRDEKMGQDAAQKVISRFINFCDFNTEDVLLDSNCGRGDFIIAAAPHVEHSLGAVSSQELYSKCLTNTTGKTNINIVNCKLDKLPFKRDMFTIVVNRFSLSLMENITAVLKELITYTGCQGKLCIQDFCEFEDSELNEFFNRFDFEIFSMQIPLNRFKTSMIGCLGFRVIKEEITEEETDLMWYFGLKNRNLNEMDKINGLIHEALNHPVLSKYVYLKNDNLCIKRRIISVMAGK